MVADFLHNRGEPQTSFYPNFGQTEPEPEPEQRLAETLSLLSLIENVTSVIVTDPDPDPGSKSQTLVRVTTPAAKSRRV